MFRTVVIVGTALTLGLGAVQAAELKTKSEAENANDPNYDKRVEAGYLSCVMTDSSNLILVSGQTFACTFERTADKFSEDYTLELTKYGLDLSVTEEQELRWAVFAPATLKEDGVLAGEYTGIGADVAVGYGIGAKGLIGGGADSIALQPLSVTKSEGLGAAVGVERATLMVAGEG